MRIFKWIGITFAALLGLALIAAVVLIARFDPNDYKSQITALIEERTGRTVAIDDTIEWSLFPWLAIETGGITIGNHPDFAANTFATIETLSARVRVWPLLSGRVELGLITLDGFALDLGTNAAGVANWSDLTPSGEPPTTTPVAGDAAASRFADLEIAGVRLENGRLLWRELGEVRYVVSDIALTTGAIEPGSPVDVATTLSVLDVASQRRADFEIVTIATVSGELVGLADIELEASVADTNGTERLAAALSTELVSITGSRRLTAAAGTLEATAVDPPVGAATVDARMTWPSLELDIDAGTASVDGIMTEVNGVTARWSLELANLDTAPTISGRLDMPAVAATTLFAMAGSEPPTGLDPAELGEVAGRGDFTAATGDGAGSGAFSLDLLGMVIDLRGSVSSDSAVDLSWSIPRIMPTPGLQSLLAGYLPAGANADAIETLTLDGSAAFSLGNPNRIDLRELSLGINDSLLTGDATVAIVDGAPADAAGEIDARLADPLLLQALLGDSFPADMPAASIGRSALAATFDYTRSTDTLAVARFDLDAFGLGAAGNLVVNSLRSAPVVRGSGTIASFDPQAALERLQQPVPQTSDPEAFRSAAFRGDFVIDSAHAEFRELTLTLDGMPITGLISVEDFDAPRYRFDLSVATLDVDRYLPPAAGDTGAGERAAGDIALDSEPLERLDLIGTARVGALKLANLEFQRVEATLAIEGGRASIDPARTELYGGTFSGALVVDSTGDSPTMRLTGQAATVELAPLITALTGESSIRGSGSFDLDLTGAGATITDTLHTATGTMSFALNSGAIEGFNLGRTLCAAYNLRERLPQPAEAPAVTEFQLIRASADVQDGIATTRDLLGRTAFMELTGTGGANLADARLDYDMTATLTAAVPIRGCETMTEFVGDSIPFTIEGPLSDPTIEPDYRELIRSRIQDEIRDRVEDRLRDRLRDLL